MPLVFVYKYIVSLCGLCGVCLRLIVDIISCHYCAIDSLWQLRMNDLIDSWMVKDWWSRLQMSFCNSHSLTTVMKAVTQCHFLAFFLVIYLLSMQLQWFYEYKCLYVCEYVLIWVWLGCRLSSSVRGRVMWSRHIPDTLATRQQQHDPPSGTLHTPTNTHNSLTVLCHAFSARFIILQLHLSSVLCCQLNASNVLSFFLTSSSASAS